MSPRIKFSPINLWLTYIAIGISQIILVVLGASRMPEGLKGLKISAFLSDISTIKIVFIILPFVSLFVAISIRFLAINRPAQTAKSSGKEVNNQKLTTFHMIALAISESSIIFLFLSTILLKDVTLLLALSPIFIIAYFIYQKPWVKIK